MPYDTYIYIYIYIYVIMRLKVKQSLWRDSYHPKTFSGVSPSLRSHSPSKFLLSRFPSSVSIFWHVFHFLLNIHVLFSSKRNSIFVFCRERTGLICILWNEILIPSTWEVNKVKFNL